METLATRLLKEKYNNLCMEKLATQSTIDNAIANAQGQVANAQNRIIEIENDINDINIALDKLTKE